MKFLLKKLEMNKMAYIIVTSDDLQPKTLPSFYKYWKPLKEKHPNLKVTFFVAPNNQEFSQGEENDISKSKEFKNWFDENKDWCFVECHGFDHTKPFENQRNWENQKEIMENSLKILKPYIDKSCLGYKAPFYKMDHATLFVLSELGFSWYSQWWNFIPLKVVNKRIPEFVEISSHTNLPEAQNPDNIDKIYDRIDYHLTKLENLGFTYSTFRQIMKEVMQ